MRPSTSNAALFVVLIVLGCLLASTSMAAAGKSVKSAAKTSHSTKKKLTPLRSLKEAKQAFEEGNYVIALNILAGLEAKYAGNIEFDFLLGRSALESKKFDLAIAAFSRILTADPNFPAARFELARTYYSKGVLTLSVGPFKQARSEFNLVLTQEPPEKIKQTINQYQKYIDKYLEVKKMQTSVFAEFSGGFDSNIGSSSSSDTFTFFDESNSTYKNYNLTGASKQQDSSYGQVQAGAGISLPLFSSNFEMFGNLLVGSKSYKKQSEFDHAWNQVKLGIKHYGTRNTKSIRFRLKRIYISEIERDYNRQSDLRINWIQKINKTNALSFSLAGGDSSFHSQNTWPFSVSTVRSSVEWTRLMQDKNSSSYQLLLLTGQDGMQQCDENNNCSNFAPYARDISGIRIAYSKNISDQSRFYSSFYLEHSDYYNDLFYQHRKDSRKEIFMGVNTRLNNAWQLRSEFRLISNDSNISLYDFRRMVASMTARWEY